MRRQATDWEKLFTNHVVHKGVASRIHKELSQLNHKETRNLMTKRRLSSKESAYQRSIAGLERPQEEEMATHSSSLVWRVPWTEEEPGGL